jgi:bacterioferritin-associated ferredoxin
MEPGLVIENDSHYYLVKTEDNGMYVCICHAITETEVESATRAGARDEKEVFCRYGVKPQCGKCIPSMRCMLRASQDEASVECEEEVVSVG